MTVVHSSEIRPLHTDPPRTPESTTVHGVSLGPDGGAIVTASWPPDGPPLAVELERFPPSLRAVGDRVTALHEADPEALIVVDGGLHGADLWEYLGRPRPPRTWRLFEVEHPAKRRGELAGRLRAAYDRSAFHVRRGIHLGLRKALSDATREDAAERVEVAALSLAVVDRRPPLPRIG